MPWSRTIAASALRSSNSARHFESGAEETIAPAPGHAFSINGRRSGSSDTMVSSIIKCTRPSASLQELSALDFGFENAALNRCNKEAINDTSHNHHRQETIDGVLSQRADRLPFEMRDSEPVRECQRHPSNERIKHECAESSVSPTNVSWKGYYGYGATRGGNRFLNGHWPGY